MTVIGTCAHSGTQSCCPMCRGVSGLRMPSGPLLASRHSSHILGHPATPLSLPLCFQITESRWTKKFIFWSFKASPLVLKASEAFFPVGYKAYGFVPAMHGARFPIFFLNYKAINVKRTLSLCDDLSTISLYDKTQLQMFLHALPGNCWMATRHLKNGGSSKSTYKINVGF